MVASVHDNNQPLSLETLRQRSLDDLRASRQSAEARVAQRKTFYRRWGLCHSPPFGWGTPEVAFVEWLAQRGALSTEHGGPWWKAIQTALACSSLMALASLSCATPPANWPADIRAWRAYFAKPNQRTWFRAHNATVLAATLAHRAEAQQEPKEEQHLIRMVLRRVVYAQALAEGATKSLGLLGRALVHPHAPLIRTLLDSTYFYPRRYPAECQDLARTSSDLPQHHAAAAFIHLARTIEGRAVQNNLVDLLAAVGQWNDQPGLEALLSRDGSLAYPALGSFAGPLPINPRII